MNNYDTEINYYNTKSFDTNNYHNFYHDTFNFRKIENISLPQRTEITNNSIETNTQTINYTNHS